jgi:hypothetical protein
MTYQFIAHFEGRKISKEFDNIEQCLHEAENMQLLGCEYVEVLLNDDTYCEYEN